MILINSRSRSLGRRDSRKIHRIQYVLDMVIWRSDYRTATYIRIPSVPWTGIAYHDSTVMDIVNIVPMYHEAMANGRYISVGVASYDTRLHRQPVEVHAGAPLPNIAVVGRSASVGD